MTEKAFPENEAVLTTGITRKGSAAVTNEFLYEHRLGKHGQYEVVVPFEMLEADGGQWRRGIGDIAVAYKHVLMHRRERGAILSAGGELILPTGNAAEGLGGEATVLEPFVTFGRILPRDGFLQLHAGVEVPVGDEDAAIETFWRAAVGRTWNERRWFRSWSPMVEALGSREMTSGEPALWDVVPQMQVSLSTRQHVLLNAGVKVPVNRRRDRGTRLMVYLLWDWFDGGVFSGW